MSKIKTWMPLYIGDYLADTGSLSTLQHGAYILLLMEIWRNGPIQNNTRRLSRVAKTDAQTWDEEIWPELRDFFTVVDGCLDQKRLRAEHEKAEEISKKRADAAAKRHSSKQTSCKSNANAEQMQSKSNANGDANDIQKDTQSQSQSQSHSLLRKESARANSEEHPDWVNESWRSIGDEVLSITGHNPANAIVQTGIVRQWLADAQAVGHSLISAREVILAVVRQRCEQGGGKGKTPKWFHNPVSEAIRSGCVSHAVSTEIVDKPIKDAWRDHVNFRAKRGEKSKSYAEFAAEWRQRNAA